MVFCFELNTGGWREAVVRALDSHQFSLGSGLAMYAIYGLGTGHYLWPGKGRGIFGGIIWFLGEQKGISLNWEPKSGDRWKLWKDSGRGGGGTQICLENEDGGDRESHQKASLQWSNIQRGYRLNFTLFCRKSSALHPPAINNDLSLRPG